MRRLMSLGVLLLATLLMNSMAFAKLNRIYEPIFVSKKLYLSPHRLCHDGLFIYFKDKNSCLKSEIQNFDCEKNYQISPIRTSEEISITDKGDFITRFYHVPMKYRYQEVDTEHDILLVNEMRTLSACEDRKLFETENIRSKRTVRTGEEKYLVQSLLDQSKKSKDESFLLINSPIGNFGKDEFLSLDDIGNPGTDLSRVAMKTPLCSDLSFEKVWKMSGEYTGTGLRGLLPAKIQTVSKPLYVKKKMWVVNQKTGELELRYEFTCDQVWEI